MKKIMVYGDSNTWGYDPNTIDPRTGANARYDENTRWTWIMKNALGPDYVLLEEGYNGRTIAFDDQTAYGRNGLKHIEVAFGTCDPVDYIVIMLGTNDLKDMFALTEVNVGDAMNTLVKTLKNAMAESNSADAKVIIVNPVNVTPCADGSFVYGFSDRSVKLGEKIGERYKAVAERRECEFFDASAVEGVEMDGSDGTHLTPKAHRALGLTMAEFIKKIG